MQVLVSLSTPPILVLMCVMIRSIPTITKRIFFGAVGFYNHLDTEMSRCLNLLIFSSSNRIETVFMDWLAYGYTYTFLQALESKFESPVREFRW